MYNLGISLEKMRKSLFLKAKRVNGRPMANGGIKRQTKRLRKQIRIELKKRHLA